MSVNDLVVQGAEPLFFLDYFSCSSLDTEVAAAVIAGIAAGCREAGCALIGGETAEMPGLYAPGDYDLAGFAVGAVERGAILPRDNIVAGDIVLGLTSSGMHSNGFSLARKVVQRAGLAWDATAPFGPKMLLSEALLTPTRIYAKSALAAIRQTSAVKALAHITSGGLTENIPRVLPKDLGARIDLRAVPVPPTFKWLAATGSIAVPEMLRTFNYSIGMVAIVAPQDRERATAAFKAAGEAIVVLGELSAIADGAPRVGYDGDLDLAP